MKPIEIHNRKIGRRYTKEWAESGTIKKDDIPKYVASLVRQHEAMVEYIEALHNKIDEMLLEEK